MAGYIGVDNKARKISKIFVGVDGKAHDVRKVYVGNAEGKAEPVWSYMPIVRKGNGPSLRATTSEHAATPVGDYAIVAGGETNYVDSFSSDLVRQTLSSLKYALSISRNCATFKNNTYAVFAGGARYTSKSMYVYSYVYAYNERLTQYSLSSLSVSRAYGTGECVGDYVIFAGGYNKSYTDLNAVDCYNSSLSKVSIASIGARRSGMNSGHTESHAIFLSGDTEDDGANKTTVAYDKNLTMTKIEKNSSLSVSYNQGASINDKYALFPLPSGMSNEYIKSFAYTDDLTVISIQDAKATGGYANCSAASFGDYAIFLGGMANNSDYLTDITNVYDSNLTCLDSDPTGDIYTYCGAASRIGTSKYCIYAGGVGNSGYDEQSRTEIYELIY